MRKHDAIEKLRAYNLLEALAEMQAAGAETPYHWKSLRAVYDKGNGDIHDTIGFDLRAIKPLAEKGLIKYGFNKYNEFGITPLVNLNLETKELK